MLQSIVRLDPIAAVRLTCEYLLVDFFCSLWVGCLSLVEEILRGRHECNDASAVGIDKVGERVSPPHRPPTTMADESILPIPNLGLPQHLFTLVSPSFSHLHENARSSLLEGIKADSGVVHYTNDMLTHIVHRYGTVLSYSYILGRTHSRPCTPGVDGRSQRSTTHETRRTTRRSRKD